MAGPSTVVLSLLLGLVAIGVPLWTLYVSPLLHLTGYLRTPSYVNHDHCTRFPIPHVRDLTLHRASDTLFASQTEGVNVWKVEEGVLRSVKALRIGAGQVEAVEILDVEEGWLMAFVGVKDGESRVDVYNVNREKMEDWSYSNTVTSPLFATEQLTSILPLTPTTFYLSVFSTSAPSILQSQLHERFNVPIQPSGSVLYCDTSREEPCETVLSGLKAPRSLSKGPEDTIYLLTAQAITSYSAQFDGSLILQDNEPIPRYLTSTTVTPSGAVYISSQPFPTLQHGGGVEVWRLSNSTGEDSHYRTLDTFGRFYGGRLRLQSIFASPRMARSVAVKGNKLILAGEENEWTEVCLLEGDDWE